MRKLLQFLLLLLITTQAHALDAPRQPDDVFKFKAEVVAPDKIKAVWDIADGFYLYRSAFKFETENTSLKLAAPIFPQGETKEDPNLGKLEIYHKQVVVEIPIERGQTASGPVELEFKAKYRGCAQQGMCYSPMQKVSKLTLAAVKVDSKAADTAANAPPASPPAPAPAPTAPLSLLSGNNGPNSPLPVEKAFVFNLVAVDKGTLKATWAIHSGNHLYRPKIKFSVKSPLGASLGIPVFPQGKPADDEYFGKIEIYDQDLEIKVPIKSENLDKLVVETEYQGCSDSNGTCYAPVKQTTELNLANLPPAPPRSEAEGTNASEVSTSPQDAISNQMRDSSFVSTLFFFLLAGLGLALTPCVFPMIPILSGIIAGYGDLSSRKAFSLSVAYVLPMALTYAVVGVIAGLSGANLQVMFQNPWVIGTFAGLFVLLSLSMFGFYDLQMPSSIQSRLSDISNRQQGGSFVGAGIMGILSALIVGPCVTAPLIGALVYIAQTRDAVLGGLALFSLGLGMGIPLLLIGTSAGRLLPRAGVWMDTTKAIFGIMMLGMAIWMLDRVVPPEITMALTGILLVVSGIYMGALEQIHEESGGWGRFWKSLGLIMLFYGAMMLFGVASGSKDLLQPLKGVFGGGVATASASETGLKFRVVKGIAGLEETLAAAKEQNKAVMFDISAKWCTSCKELDKYTFRDPKVVSLLENTLLIRADVSDNDEQDVALTKRFGLFGPPAILFFTPDGQEKTAFRVAGYVKALPFADHVSQFLDTMKP